MAFAEQVLLEARDGGGDVGMELLNRESSFIAAFDLRLAALLASRPELLALVFAESTAGFAMIEFFMAAAAQSICMLGHLTAPASAILAEARGFNL